MPLAGVILPSVESLTGSIATHATGVTFPSVESLTRSIATHATSWCDFSLCRERS
jgi:hypothetical protein